MRTEVEALRVALATLERTIAQLDRQHADRLAGPVAPHLGMALPEVVALETLAAELEEAQGDIARLIALARGAER